MPVYEYRCESCHRQFEKIQKFSDPPLSRCEACGGALKKLLSPPALVFKGTGWYITDYSRKKPEQEKGKKAAPSGTQDAGGSGSPPASPAKPAQNKKKDSQ